MCSTCVKRKSILKILLVLLLMTLMGLMAGCSSQTNRSVTWPVKLNVIELIDGGVCLDAESAKRLAELRADIEAL